MMEKEQWQIVALAKELLDVALKETSKVNTDARNNELSRIIIDLSSFLDLEDIPVNFKVFPLDVLENVSFMGARAIANFIFKGKRISAINFSAGKSPTGRWGMRGGDEN